MKRGFELLKTKNQNEKINFSDYEDKFGFLLPPLFKLFMETFYTGDRSFNWEYFYNPKWNENYVLNAPLYEPLKDDEKLFLSISGVKDLDVIFDEWNSFLKYEKEWSDFNFLQIASIGQGGGLFVSTRNEDKDVIYQVIWDGDEPYYKVTDNIFELIRGLVLPEITNLLPDGYSVNQLYKKYGDNFWSVDENSLMD
jgi:hypothetical protein